MPEISDSITKKAVFHKKKGKRPEKRRNRERRKMRRGGGKERDQNAERLGYSIEDVYKRSQNISAKTIKGYYKRVNTQKKVNENV